MITNINDNNDLLNKLYKFNLKLENPKLILSEKFINKLNKIKKLLINQNLFNSLNKLNNKFNLNNFYTNIIKVSKNKVVQVLVVVKYKVPD